VRVRLIMARTFPADRRRSRGMGRKG